MMIRAHLLDLIPLLIGNVLCQKSRPRNRMSTPSFINPPTLTSSCTVPIGGYRRSKRSRTSKRSRKSKRSKRSRMRGGNASGANNSNANNANANNANANNANANNANNNSSDE